MSARRKVEVLIAALVFANLAVFGAKEILGALYDPIIRSLGA